MEYSNIEIFRELKKIWIEHKKTNDLDEIADSIYTEHNSWIIWFLLKEWYINIPQVSTWRLVPFLSSQGKDFLKNKNIVSCFVADHQWSINIIVWLVIAIIWWIYVYLLTI